MSNNELPQVNIRGGFSDRNKIKSQNTIIQKDNFDNITRMDIFNKIKALVDKIDKRDLNRSSSKILTQIINNFLNNVFHDEVDYKIDNYNSRWFLEKYVKPTILLNNFYAVLDFIEYFTLQYSEKMWDKLIFSEINCLFEQEYVGYRFVNKQIVPITDQMEIEEIEKAVNENPFDNSKKLLQEALNKLSDRNNKDFAGCIHKSISAVESVCQILLGKQKSLGDALKKLEENGIKINGALKSAFSTLYGWTSNNGNIRHANIKNSDNPTFDEAKFMVIACSAFINYLISKKSKFRWWKWTKLN